MRNKRIINIIFFLGFFVVFGFLSIPVSKAIDCNEAGFECADTCYDTVFHMFGYDKSCNGQKCCDFTQLIDCDGKCSITTIAGYSRDENGDVDCQKTNNNVNSLCYVKGSSPTIGCNGKIKGDVCKTTSGENGTCNADNGACVVNSESDECKGEENGTSCKTTEGDSGTCKSEKCVKNVKDPKENSCTGKEDDTSCKTSEGEDGACKEEKCIKTGETPDPNDGECIFVEEGIQGGFLFFKGSIVPCGRNCDIKSTDVDETKTCTLCHFIIMFFNIFEFLISLLVVVALLFITISGVAFLVSAGNPNLRTTAKNILTKTLTGFGIALLSWLIIFTLLKFISAKNDMLGSGGKWNEFKCETESIFDSKNSDEGGNTGGGGAGGGF